MVVLGQMSLCAEVLVALVEQQVALLGALQEQEQKFVEVLFAAAGVFVVPVVFVLQVVLPAEVLFVEASVAQVVSALAAVQE